MSVLIIAGAGIVLAAFVVFAVRCPRLALLTLVTLDVSNINGVLADLIGVSPYKPLLGLAGLILLIMLWRRMFRFCWSPVLLGLMILFSGFCLSFLAAADSITATSLLVERGRDGLYFLIVFALMLSTNQLTSVMKAAVGVLAALAALTVVHEFVLHNAGDLYGLSRVPLVQEGGALTPRHAGTSSDVNFWGRLLILFTPMSMSLFALSPSWRRRVLWGGSTVALLLGVYLTQSRGGFIALFVAMVVWAVLAGGRYRKSLLYVPFALLVLVPLSGIGTRLLTLTAITAGSTATADPSVVTRKRFQLDAWHMFLDRPLTGHGIGSYGVLFPSYDRLANFYDPVTIVVAAHNFYLEQAADGGVILLLAWVLFFGIVFFTAFRARKIAAQAQSRVLQLLAVGVISGSLGWLVASIFLHLSDFRALLLLAAIAAVIDVRARQLTVDPGLVRQPPPMMHGTNWVRWMAVVSGASVIGLGTVLATTSTTYSNSATLGVVPNDADVNPATAYQLDIVSRGLIVPTFAEVLTRSITVEALVAQAGGSGNLGDVSVSAQESRLGGGVVVTVTAGNEDIASNLGAAAVVLSRETVSDLRSGYQLIGTMSGPRPVPSDREWWLLGLTTLLVTSAATGLVADRRRVRTADPTDDGATAEIEKASR